MAGAAAASVNRPNTIYQETVEESAQNSTHISLTTAMNCCNSPIEIQLPCLTCPSTGGLPRPVDMFHCQPVAVIFITTPTPSLLATLRLAICFDLRTEAVMPRSCRFRTGFLPAREIMMDVMVFALRLYPYAQK